MPPRQLLLFLMALASICLGSGSLPVAGEWGWGTFARAEEQTLPPAPPPGATKPAPAATVTPPAATTSKAPLAAKENPPGKNPAPKKKIDPAIPEKVLKVLEYVDKNDKAMEGYEGGRNFGNFEKRLPQNDDKGRRIKYREWDVNPRRPGVNRGAERLVTGSDRHAYYTSDHYNTFRKIR